ncbi:hypothetical protein [Pseudomonas sp. IT-P294]|jgi:hypothetical protein|uniref:hypothetical protein n=1 Tax=Pseudomonas sp. IT-P294 TaxID=3026454 RepID=UPI0039E105A4
MESPLPQPDNAAINIKHPDSRHFDKTCIPLKFYLAHRQGQPLCDTNAEALIANGNSLQCAIHTG